MRSIELVNSAATSLARSFSSLRSWFWNALRVIKKAASAKAYDAQLSKAALQYLKNKVKGVDVNGSGFRPISVTLRAGGK